LKHQTRGDMADKCPLKTWGRTRAFTKEIEEHVDGGVDYSRYTQSERYADDADAWVADTATPSVRLFASL